MIDIDKMIQNALKNGIKDQVKAYRNLKSKILLVKTAKNAKYDETTEVSIISKYVKELEADSASYFAVDRDDLGQEYAEEACILKALLPKQPTTEELTNAVWDFIETNNGPIPENKTIPKSQMGICIKYIKNRYPSTDGKTVSEIVRGFIA